MEYTQWIRKRGVEPLELVEKEGVPFLQFPALTRTKLVRHGFSTRLGGVSNGIFSSMNLTFQRGDEKEAVYENFSRMARALGSSTQQMVFSHQTHTTNIRVVGKEDCGLGIERELTYTDIDGLVTNEPGVMLVTFFADCVPVYLVDTKRSPIGLCHAGWRGTVGQITKEALKVMHQQYGTEPEDIVAAIGPSICQECYEVSQEVIDACSLIFSEEELKEVCYKKANDHYQLDLWKCNQLILMQAGVPKEQIALPDICTCCNPSLLFSHRASKGQRGNLAAFLELL